MQGKQTRGGSQLDQGPLFTLEQVREELQQGVDGKSEGGGLIPVSSS